MEKLTIQEEQALLACWELGAASVKTILDHIRQPIPYTTLASTIKNLEKKGYLSSSLDGNTYIYRPIVSEKEYKRSFMGKVVKNYFHNSYKEMVTFFIKENKLSERELKELIKQIESSK